MATIEHRVEGKGANPNYSGKTFTPEEIAQGAHRKFVGGVWDTHGQRQVDYLTSNGLKPTDTLLDVGCGCLRAGRIFVDYLEPGHYYGIDANHSLVQTGYDVELTQAQRDRLPAGNLRANDRFNVDFDTTFDVAWANSVYTHVSLNHIRLSLYRIAASMRPGGVFYATFFEQPSSTAIDRIVGLNRPKPFFTERNVYWYYRSDLEWAASFSPWRFTYIGDWGHPANQKMAKFTRLTDEEWGARAGGSAPTKAKPAGAAKPRPSTTTTSAELPLRQELKRFSVRGLRWLARRLDR